MADKDNDLKEKRGSFEEDFEKKFKSGIKKASTEHKHDLDREPKYDSDVMESGLGGFNEPDDDGIEP
jgi:hypothetical protein